MSTSSEPVVFCVFVESGEYEQWSRDLYGVFSTRELAEQHRTQLVKEGTVKIEEWEVETELPHRVLNYERSAHIRPDGSEDKQSRYPYGDWSNRCPPLRHYRIDRWTHDSRPDLYIEVSGCDKTTVEAQYQKLLAEARQRLVTSSSASTTATRDEA